MTVTSPLRIVPILLIAVTLGCSSETRAGRYGKSRVLDALDVLPVSLGAGYGLAAEVRATPFLGLGVGYANDWRIGVDQLRFGPIWWEEERGIPFFRYFRHQDYADRTLRYEGGYPELRTDYRKLASSLIILPGMGETGLVWGPFLPPYAQDVTWDWNAWTLFEVVDVEASLFVGFVGLRVGLSPLHLFDFIVGLIGFDPADDDVPKPRPALWPEPLATPASFPTSP